jgi:hypothetical protein
MPSPAVIYGFSSMYIPSKILFLKDHTLSAPGLALPAATTLLDVCIGKTHRKNNNYRVFFENTQRRGVLS